MMQFSAGLVMIWIAYKIWKRTWVKPEPDKTEALKNHYQASIDMLREQCELVGGLVRRYEGKIEEIQLNRQIAMDAVRRQERAEEALKAVLKENGLTPDDIDQVIERLNQ